MMIMYRAQTRLRHFVSRLAFTMFSGIALHAIVILKLFFFGIFNCINNTLIIHAKCYTFTQDAPAGNSIWISSSANRQTRTLTKDRPQSVIWDSAESNLPASHLTAVTVGYAPLRTPGNARYVL